MLKKHIDNPILAMIAVLDKAISMERNALKFYTSMATRIQSMKGQDIFKRLAKQEVGHVRTLTKQRAELSMHESVKGLVKDIDYNESLTEISLGFEIDSNATEEEILTLAIQSEKKAYTYYQKKMTVATDPSVKSLLSRIADEELKHWEYLKAQKRNIRLGGEWDEPVGLGF